MGCCIGAVYTTILVPFGSCPGRRLANQHFFRQLLYRSMHPRLQVEYGQTDQEFPRTHCMNIFRIISNYFRTIEPLLSIRWLYRFRLFRLIRIFFLYKTHLNIYEYVKKLYRFNYKVIKLKHDRNFVFKIIFITYKVIKWY